MRLISSWLYLFFITLLTIYSYSQIDLNLTLSSNNIYQAVQRQLIYLGYFNRPLSTLIYIILIITLFIFYIVFLRKTNQGRTTKEDIFKLIILTSLILTFAYSAFSHDIFNYMFDARIVTKYGMNPYLYKALDFEGDLWIRFMHWTHRTYPYGPIWLLISLPFSFLGMQKFVITLFLFKLLFLASYLFNCFFIYKIADKVNKETSISALVFFAFNPLILIESLVSPHNDSLMLLFALCSIYLLFVKGKKINSIILMLISAGIKFVTIPLTFINLFFVLKDKKVIKNHRLYRLWSENQKGYDSFFRLYALIFFLSLLPVIYNREILPWYFIPFIGLVSLIIEKRGLLVFSICLSFGLLLKYISFLYFGEWDDTSYFYFVVVLITILFLSLVFYRQRNKFISLGSIVK